MGTLLCQRAGVHLPLKDRQLNILHLVECISAHQKDEQMIQNQS